MILVFDFGTTTIKAALFNAEGALVSSKSFPIRMQSAEDPTAHEVDPAEWLRAMGSLCTALLPQGASDVRAIVVSGNGPTLVAAGSGGRPLRPAITWLDRRGLAEAQFVRDRCGVFVDSSFYLPKILWLKNHEPEAYEKAAHFLSCSDYIIYHLTGEAVMVFPGEGL
ncbi:MAG: hypothetical protein JW852_07550, partial [Spirochaetales bacterium]|nr:hypothetical protein [Spirochaetales bacterium]